MLSVIIPVFNGETTLTSCIRSAQAQHGIDTEILVIDDGSTDRSAAVAQSFGPKVRLFTGPNGGVSAARNRGIAAASGEWIVFLDADDLLLPETLRRRLDAADTTGADVIVCDWQDFVDEKDLAGCRVNSPDMEALSRDPEVACATSWKPAVNALMFQKASIEKVGGFPEDLEIVEDARLLFDLACRGARFAHSAHLGARVRYVPQSLSRSDPARFWRYCLINGRQIEQIWRARGALSAKKRTALAEIYNGAAHGLFRAGDPSFRNALAALRASGLSVSGRNRLAELMSDCAGQRSALRAAEFWTKSRRLFSRHLVRPAAPAPDA